MNSPESALLLSDLYDNHLELHNNENSHLLGAVMYSEAENPYVCTSYQNILKNYVKCGIQKVFNISLKEYMDLPIWQVEIMNEVGIDTLTAMSKDMQNINDELTKNMEEL